jgi:hypothetical protein
MTCSECGGFVPIRAVQADEGEGTAPSLEGSAMCARCNASNVITNAVLFVIDGQRLRRIRLSSPGGYVK